jgi:hypothetical protein
VILDQAPAFEISAITRSLVGLFIVSFPAEKLPFIGTNIRLDFYCRLGRASL